MGDRCYMSLYCRESDADKFEALGFQSQGEIPNSDGSPLSEMVDEEANYAHSGEIDKVKAPFFGHHAGGGDYGPGMFACDGKRYCEAAAGHNDLPLVEVDPATGEPNPEDLKLVRDYLACLARAKLALGWVDEKPADSPAEPPPAKEPSA